MISPFSVFAVTSSTSGSVSGFPTNEWYRVARNLFEGERGGGKGKGEKDRKGE
jgi:hypothetical protein